MIKLGILLSIVILAIGCSSDGSLQAPVRSDQTTENNTLSTVEFEGLQIQLPEGWAPVTLRGADRLDTPRPRDGMREGDIGNSMTCVTRRAERGIFLNQIHHNWTGCWIPGSALPRNRMDIEVCVDTLLAICDFGPHGTNFSGDIWIRIDFQYLGLDPDQVDLEQDIAIFYVQDDGTLLEMPHWVDWTGHALVGLTNHFSRYIISQRVSG